MDARVCMCVRLQSSVEPEDRNVLPGPRYGGLLLVILLWTQETEETRDEDSGKRRLVVEDSTVVLSPKQMVV